MNNITRAAVLAAMGTAVWTATPAHASSHREAPSIAGEPRLDGTDFYMFRSYEPGRSGYVTFIANYQPFEFPGGGPNYFLMDQNAYYDINVDNAGTGLPAKTFRFKFNNNARNFKLNIGGKQVAEPLLAIGQIGRDGNAADNANQNVLETYTVSLVTAGGSAPVTNAADGSSVFGKPIDNIGAKTLPNYAGYANSFIYNVNIPGCASQGRVFAGQRKESFVIQLGETFDLVNYAHPIGEQFNNASANTLDGFNVTSLIMEVPIACLTAGGDPVIGGWTTSSKVYPQSNGSLVVQQKSRLGSPLVNELVIGLKDKDKWNASVPANDAQFATYVTNPTFPALVANIFGAAGVKAPTQLPRQDLVAVFLTGLNGVTMPKTLVTPCEELRLNTSIAPTAAASQSRLGVIGGDNAGYPNGRRPGDDVVDITLRVAMGRLYTLGLFGGSAYAPSGGLDFTDGAYVDASFFGTAFPYLNLPIAGSP